MPESLWEKMVAKHLWLQVQEDWKRAQVDEEEEPEACDGPVTKFCRSCQRDLPIHTFRWLAPSYEPDTSPKRDIHPGLSEHARNLNLIEDDEYVYCMFFLSNDRGQTVHRGLGGTPRKAKRALTTIARGK